MDLDFEPSHAHVDPPAEPCAVKPKCPLWPSEPPWACRKPPAEKDVVPTMDQNFVDRTRQQQLLLVVQELPPVEHPPEQNVPYKLHLLAAVDAFADVVVSGAVAVASGAVAVASDAVAVASDAVAVVDAVVVVDAVAAAYAEDQEDQQDIVARGSWVVLS
jgi:hypothetical protein